MRYIGFSAILLLALASCTQTQINESACLTQQIANAAGAVAETNGNAQAAQNASLLSQEAGKLCMQPTDTAAAPVTPAKS